MKKMLKCLHLFAGILFASLSFAAVEPVAVWSGDLADNSTKNDITLTLNGNSVSEGVVTIDQAKGIQFYNNKFNTKIITVLVKYSNFDVTATTSRAMITVGGVSGSTATGKNDDGIGIYANGAAVKGLKNGAAATTGTSSGSFSSSGVIALTHNGTSGGTNGYLGDGTKVYAGTTLKITSPAPLYTRFIGVGGNYAVTGKLAAATGMKIEGVAIFETVLSTTDIAEYEFPTPGPGPEPEPKLKPAVLWNGDFDVTEKDGYTLNLNNHTVAADGSHILMGAGTNGIEIDWDTGIGAATVIFKCENVSTEVVAQKNSCYATVYNTQSLNRVGVIRRPTDGKLQGIWANTPWGDSPTPDFPTSTGNQIYALGYQYDKGTIFCSYVNDAWTTLLDEAGLGSPAYDNNSIKGFSILGYRGSSDNMIALEGAKVTAVAVFDKKLTAEEIAAYEFPSKPSGPKLVWEGNSASEGKILSQAVEKGKPFTLIINMVNPDENTPVGSYIINKVPSAGQSFTPFCIATDLFADFDTSGSVPNSSVYFYEKKSGGFWVGVGSRSNEGNGTSKEEIKGDDVAAYDSIYVAYSGTVGADGVVANYTRMIYAHNKNTDQYYTLSDTTASLTISDSLDTMNVNSSADALNFKVYLDNAQRDTDGIKQAIEDIINPPAFIVEATISGGTIKVSDINALDELKSATAETTVNLTITASSTLEFDEPFKCKQCNVILDGTLTFAGEGLPDYEEYSKFNFKKVTSIDYEWIAIGSGMAINFHSSGRSLGDSDEAGIPGLTIYGNCWNNYDEATGNITAKMFAHNGSDIIVDTMPVNWSCANIYQWDDASVTAPYLKGYLDDTNSALAFSATVPFGCYDLYIICATDNGNVTFSPKVVNGVKYTANSSGEAIKGSEGWGMSHGSTPILGTNVMRVSGLTAQNLTISAPRENGRGCIAAIVVVKVQSAKIVDVDCGDGKSMSEINAIDADAVNLRFNDGGVLTMDQSPNKPCNIVGTSAVTLDGLGNATITDDDWNKFDFTRATGNITIKVNASNGLVAPALKSMIQSAGDNLTFIFKGLEDAGVTLDFGQTRESINCHVVFDGGTHAMTYLNNNTNVPFGVNGTADKPTLLVTNGATLNFTAKDISWYSGVVDVNGVIRVNDGATLNFLQSEATTFFYRQRLWLDPGSTMTFNYGITHYGSGDESDFRWQGGTTNGMEQIYVPASDVDMTDKPAIIQQLGDGDLHLASDATRGLAIFVGENSKLQLDTEFSRAEDAATIKTGGGILEFKRDVTAPITIYGGGIGFASECSTSDLIFESDNTLIEVAAGITVSPNITRNGHSIVKLGEGALMLNAGYEGELTLKEGVLKLKLSVAQMATGYTAAGVTFGEGITGITFVLPDGTEIPTEGKTYEGGGLLWTGEAGDKFWKTPGNWSTGTVPTADDAVAISFAAEIIVEAGDTCKMLSIQNDVSLSGSFDNLGMAAIDPEKTLTITVAASEEKVFPSVTGAGSLVKAGDGVLVVANVPEGPMEIASGKLIVTANAPATISTVISGEGCFEKRGPEALTLTAENTLTGGLIVGEGVLKMGAGKCLGPYYTEEVGYATIVVKEGAALDTNGQTNGGSLARTYAVQFEANAILTDTGTRTNDLKFFPLSKIIALGDMFIDVDEEKNVGISLHYNSDGVELDLGEHTVTKRGEGEFVLGSGAPIIGTGKLLIQEGTLTTQPKNGGATSVAEDGTIEFADGTVFNPTSYSGANGDITAANIIYNGIIFGETGTLTATKKLSGKGIANNVVVGDGATIDATGEGEFLVSSVRFGSALTVISETGADLFMVGGARPALPTSLTVLLPDGSPNRGSFSLQYVDSKVVLACTVIAFELPVIENASFKVEGGEIVDEHYARVAIGGNATISYTTNAGYSFYDEMGAYTGKSLIKFVLESLAQDPKITELLKDVTTRQAVVSIRSGDETEYYFDFMEAFDLLQENDELILYADAILTLTDPYEVLANTVITLNGFELRGSEAVSFLIDGGIAFYLYEQYVFNPADEGTVNDNITFTLTDGIIYSYAPLKISSDSYIKIYSEINGYTYAPSTKLETITASLRAGEAVELPDGSEPKLIEALETFGYDLEKVSTMSVGEYKVIISPDEAVNGSKIESFEIAGGKATITIPAKSNLYYGLEYANNPAFSGSQVKWAEQGAKTLSADAEGANMFYRVLITDKDPTIK